MGSKAAETPHRFLFSCTRQEGGYRQQGSTASTVVPVMADYTVAVFYSPSHS